MNPSSTLQHHLLSTLRGMTNKVMEGEGGREGRRQGEREGRKEGGRGKGGREGRRQGEREGRKEGGRGKGGRERGRDGGTEGRREEGGEREGGGGREEWIYYLLSFSFSLSQFQGALFKDSPEYCGAMCYQVQYNYCC